MFSMDSLQMRAAHLKFVTTITTPGCIKKKLPSVQFSKWNAKKLLYIQCKVLQAA